MRTSFATSVLVLALLAPLTGCQLAPWRTGSPAPEPEVAQRPSDFDRLVSDAERHEGFFDLYVKDANLYMAVPRGRLGEEFLMEFKIARGLGTAGIHGGTMLSLFEADVVAFEKHGDRLFLLKRPHRFRAEAGTPQAEAVELSFSSSVLESARIEATQGDSLYLIDIRDWILSDMVGISQALRGLTSTGQGPGAPPNFDRNRSYLESVKAFPENLNIRAVLTYRASQPVAAPAIPDGRFLSLAIHHTMAALPAEPMVPREGDDRVGFFLTVHKDFTRDDGDSHFVRYVNRWRLEPGEPAGGGLVYAREPITFYLDRTIPEEYVRYFVEGVEAWNTAFEEAGFRDAIRALQLPEDADPDDIRYPTLRWNTSDQPTYSAIGPSVVDPRTGEILDANPLFEANMILGFRRSWQNLVDPGTALGLALGSIGDDPEAAVAALMNHHHLAGIMSDQGILLRAVLAARGEIGPGDEVPEAFVGEALRWVVMHEVGHSIGLRHNFRSSVDTPVERLHDREWARTRGLVSSVMDYHSPNVALPGEPQGYFYTPGVGTADRWKIAFGYTADPDRARELARLAETDGRTYGTDEDARGPGAMDPTVNIYDLGDDPLAWGKERTRLIAGLWPNLADHVLTDDTRYAELTSAFQALLGQYSQALAPAVKYIGGEYVYRTRPGDPGDRGPFIPVERDRQLEALRFLADRGLSEEAFALAPETMARLGPGRWNHWGVSNTFNGRIDFPYHERVLNLQTQLLGDLMHPFRLARMRDAELRFGQGAVLTIPELFEALTGVVWSEVLASPARNVSSVRRDLQRDHLDRLARFVVSPPARTPADARAVARMQLRDLDAALGRALRTPGRFDAYTRAHLEESRARIGQALDAGLEAAL